ncbi:MAG: acyl-CoA thioesterase [Phycisphaerales bacterium]|nr:acyl-CoA thioesterase [Phycisphaerales bacterium]
MSTEQPTLVTVSIPVAWGEMDALGHVNNIVYFRYMETARVAFIRALGWEIDPLAKGVGVILHSVQCRFRAPLSYPDTLMVTARLAAIEDDRFTVEHELTSAKTGGLVATGSGIIVAYDYGRAAKASIPEPFRSRLIAALGNART